MPQFFYKSRLKRVPKTALILSAFYLGGFAAHAAPQIATSPSPSARPSVAGAQPDSAIAAPTRDLVARSQPRAQKAAAISSPDPSAPEASDAPESPLLATTSPLPTNPVQATVMIPIVKTVQPKAATPKVVADTTSSSKSDKILLAQLEADLMRTEKRLDTTSEKLSAGQKQLMSLSNTLRTVMLDEGEDAAGLHPFVKVASRYMGTPYVWGGESRYGFDCSGFIIIVMRDLGYKALPHSAAEQFKYGQPVARALLKPGDIVFFANTYKPGISHVGIYIGKGRFIHAASTRQGTIVSSLNASPYNRKYAGARRLIPAGKRA